MGRTGEGVAEGPRVGEGEGPRFGGGTWGSGGRVRVINDLLDDL